MNELNPCKTCGHDQKLHIYLEGACRPGFLCPSLCEEFIPTKPADLTTEQKLDIAVSVMKENFEVRDAKVAYVITSNGTPMGLSRKREKQVIQAFKDLGITERNEHD